MSDTFIRVPLIEALKECFPSARITTVVDLLCEDILVRHPDCDEIVPFSRHKKDGLKYLLNTIGKLRYLRRQHFDLCFDFYGVRGKGFCTGKVAR